MSNSRNTPLSSSHPNQQQQQQQQQHEEYESDYSSSSHQSPRRLSHRETLSSLHSSVSTTISDDLGIASLVSRYTTTPTGTPTAETPDGSMLLWSDDDMDVSFLDIPEEDIDVSQADLDTVAALATGTSLNPPSLSVFSITTPSAVSNANRSVASSTTTTTTANDCSTVTGGRNAPHAPPSSTEGGSTGDDETTTAPLAWPLPPHDDTTTSYNTEEGYADDESEPKRLASQDKPTSRDRLSTRHASATQNTTRPPLSPTPQTQTLPLSPPRLTGPLRSSSTLSPPSLPVISSAVATATLTPNAASIPPSASLFRYLRSWGRNNPGEALSTGDGSAAPTTGVPPLAGTTDRTGSPILPRDTMNPFHNSSNTAAAVTMVEQTVVGSGGELTSDDEDDEISLGSQEETSWVDDDDGSETSVDNEFMGREWEAPVDWHHLPMIPNRFCVSLHPSNAKPPDDHKQMTALPGGSGTHIPPLHYLDSSLLHRESGLTVEESNEFVWGHGALLQAVLQLLAERDQVGVEGSTDSTENIWKKGPLKKLSFAVGRRKHQRLEVAGAWKVKYIELRQGNLCYYEDSARTGRKTIHLRQADTVVQESSYRGPGFVFELLGQGSPTRYWMASSEVERQAWIKAIQAAMIGSEAPRKIIDLQPYEESLKVYASLRESLQLADSQQLYLAAIQAAMKELASLQVPVQWVQERIENDLSPILLGTLKPPKFGRSPQKMLKLSISEFWKNMSQTTFSINGLTVPRSSQLASERIVGALTRCILEFDKAFTSSDERDDVAEAQSQISELQAVSYARHIFLTALRSKERQDTSFVTRYLLENPGVVVTEQYPTENMENPVNMEVSFAGEDLPDEFLHSVEISTWVWTRMRRKNQSAIAATVSTTMWKHRHTFAVLSGTVLSYYAAASPRPHGLRGQLVLNATSSVRDEGEEIVPETTMGDGSSSTKNNGVRYVLCIISENHQDRLLSFENHVDATAWKEAIQLAIDSAGSIQHPPRIVTTTTTTPLMAPAKMLKGAERVIKVAADGTIQSGIRVIKGAKDGGIRVIKGAKDGGIRVIKTATGSGFKVIRGAVSMLRQGKGHDQEPKSRRPSLQMLLNNTIVQGKREPSVQCVFHTTQTFVIRDTTYTEHGSEQETESGRGVDDGWISVQAKLYQAFLMSGGPSGRIARGDALVELVFVETKVEPDDDASC